MRIHFINLVHLFIFLLLFVKCIKKKKINIKNRSINRLKKNNILLNEWKCNRKIINTISFLKNNIQMLSFSKRSIKNNFTFNKPKLKNLLCSLRDIERTKIRDIFKIDIKSESKKNFKICGWIKSVRTVGKNCFLFIDINDGSYFKNLQVIIDANILNYDEILKTTTDDSIECVGELKSSIGKNQKIELCVYDVSKNHYVKLFKSINDINENNYNKKENNDHTYSNVRNSDNNNFIMNKDIKNMKENDKKENIVKNDKNKDEYYMISKKYHTKQYLRNFPHLRGRTKLYSSIFRLKSDIIYETFNYFRKKNFTYINTPILTSIDCEGAGKLFYATTLFNKENENKTNANNTNINNKNNFNKNNFNENNFNEKDIYQKDFFKKPCYLNVSSQLALECLCCSIGDVFTINQSFRAEKSNTFRHLSEFLMLEVEIPFSNLNDIISLSEDYIKEMIKFALYKSEEIEYLYENHDKNLKKKLENVLNQKFMIITYDEVVHLLKEKNISSDLSWGIDLSFEQQKFLTNDYFKSPVVIINYPDNIKPFYMKLNADKKTVSCMDIIFPDIGEIVGGSEREIHLDTLKKKMNNQKLDVNLYEPYIQLRKYGNIPHSGFGLGIDRLIMFISSINNIKDIVTFPRYPNFLFM
ncbi:asparagine--tRNA ligase, putative [Plasmodium gallinaceum]|uniref:asparagine--tRNA ligase n=1 Tax=Plasmodium gallinaceum TaxID=5849 RepID=A0A1J1H3F1_PLAGA|nr:asparagine--tRNA ligase, putative [Plasmodium gallinaceum]CRG97872.1 asparagine--tRNA ligase, putative [Plasmodium gallinaceum]